MYTQKINFISQSQHLQDAHLDAVGYLQWSLAFQLGETQVQHWNSLKVKFPPKFLSPCGSIKTLPFSGIFGFPKKKSMEEVRCETSWVRTTLTSVAGWDTLWHSALKHSCSCVEDQLPEWQLRRFCHATLTTATKTLWSLLLPCYYYSNVYN